MGFWDKLLGRSKKGAGDMAGDASTRSEGMQQEQEGMAEDRAGSAEDMPQAARDEPAERES